MLQTIRSLRRTEILATESFHNLLDIVLRNILESLKAQLVEKLLYTLEKCSIVSEKFKIVNYFESTITRRLCVCRGKITLRLVKIEDKRQPEFEINMLQ